MKLSLKKRLIWTLMALILFSWVASALLTYLQANRVLMEQVDRQLALYQRLVTYTTRVFERQLAQGLPLYEAWSGLNYDQSRQQAIVIDAEGALGGGTALAVNIWEEGHLIAVVQDSPRFGHPQQPGYQTQELEDGGRWRTLSSYDEKMALWIVVGFEMVSARRDLQATLAQSLAPLLVVLPLTLMVLYFGVTAGLRPLMELATQIRRRKPGLLDPVDTRSVPVEAETLVNELNALLARLALALESEQRFTANAAHELMTPLAAIKAEVQLCQRKLQGTAEAEMLSRITLRVDRASHTVEQLLVLARLDPEQPLPMEQLDLVAVVRESFAEQAVLAAQRGLSVTYRGASSAAVDGGQEALAILARNLAANALRYASEGSEVVVEVAVGERVTLSVANDCEPLPAAEFDRVQDRFYRVPGSGGTGAGLGLSIVARIAQLHRASLSLHPGQAGRGFVVELGFPQVAASGA